MACSEELNAVLLCNRNRKDRGLTDRLIVFRPRSLLHAAHSLPRSCASQLDISTTHNKRTVLMGRALIREARQRQGESTQTKLQNGEKIRNFVYFMMYDYITGEVLLVSTRIHEHRRPKRALAICYMLHNCTRASASSCPEMSSIRRKTTG